MRINCLRNSFSFSKFLLRSSLLSLLIVFAFGSAQAQCPAGSNVGSVLAPGAIGNRTLVSNALWGNENVHITNLTIGATYTIDLCGNSHDTQLTVFEPNATAPTNTNFNTNGCTTDDGVVTFIATTTTVTAQHNEAACGSNGAVNASLFITLDILGATCTAGTFTSQPTNQTACPNGTATFTADTTGGGAADSLRWEVSTNGGSTWSILGNNSPYSGVTTLMLTVNPATTGLNGRQYRCAAFYCSPIQRTNSNGATLFVNDLLGPSITCPANQTQALDNNCQTVLVDYTGSATVSDNCDPSPTVTQSPTGTTLSSAGQSIVVSLFATDASNNANNCTFTVTAVDDTPPTVTCPANQFQAVGGSCQVLLADFTSATTVSDNCDASPSLTQSPVPGTPINGGNSLTVSMFAQDVSSNGASCTFTVTASDTTAPTITCPGPQTLVLDSTCQASVPDYRGMATASDNCGTPSLTQNPVQGSTVSGIGTFQVTITATDGSNLVDSCSFVVTKVDNTPPTITCPGPQNGFVDGSCQVSLPDFTSSATTSDNCDASPAVTQSLASGMTVSGAGTMISVTLRSTDASSNLDSCSFTFITVDSLAPTAVCQNITVILNGSGTANIVASDVNNGSTDNCGTATVSIDTSGATFTCANLGANSVTLTATDASNNMSSCVATVTVMDTIPPVISCPATQTLALDIACQASLPDYRSLATTSDNCGAPTVTQVPAPGTTVSGAGAMSVTLIASDGTAVDSCSFTVNKVDNTPPVLTCPVPQTGFVDGSCQVLLPDFTAGTANDNCDATPGVTQTPSAGTTVSGANTTITVSLFASDASANSATCTFSFTSADSIAPNAVCQNITVQLDSTGNATISAANVDNGSTDNCGTPVLTIDSSSFTCANIGPNPVTLTATDASNNMGTCVATVTVLDNAAPTITCPAMQNLVMDTSCQASLPDYTGSATVSDNCGAPMVTQSPPAGTTVSGTGPMNVTLTATDVSNNVDTCSFIVNKIDNTPPVLTCLGPQTAAVDSSCQVLLPDFTAGTATDNCDSSPTVTQTPPPGTPVSGAGTSISVSLFASDASSNNSASCTFSFTAADFTPPVAICQNITIFLNTGGTATIAPGDINGGSTDNCGTANPVGASPSAFNCTNLGPNTVLLTVQDGSNNSDTCNAIVTVMDSVFACCNPATPVVTVSDANYCPGDSVTLSATYSGSTPIGYQWQESTNGGTTWANLANGGTNPVVSGAMMPSLLLNGVPTSSSGFQYRLIAVNACSVDSSQIATITSDTTAPVITCPANQVGFVNASCEVSLPDFASSTTVTDNCDPSPSVTQVPTPGGTVSGAGTVVPVTLITMDVSGNTDSCSFTFTATDSIPPLAVCQNITVVLSAGGAASITAADINGGATDNCGPVTLSASQTSFSCSDVGMVADTLTVTDGSSNTSTCIAMVTVMDTTPPVIVCRNDTIYLDNSGNAGINSSIAAQASGDACGAPFITLSDTAFTCSDIGPNMVTVTATDNSGNTSTCVSTITIQDSIAPIAVCQDITIQLDTSGNVSITGADIDGGSSDACGIASLSASQNTFTCAEVGANTVILTVTDTSGNSSTCTSFVTVSDTVPPTAVCQNITIQLDATGNASIVGADVDGGSTDACGIASLSASPNSFSCADVGMIMVTLTVTDSNTNSSTCTAMVTVEDNNPPTAICQDITVQLDASGNASIAPSDIDGGSSDACGIASLIVSDTTSDCSDVGTNNVTLLVIDNNGNTDSCTAVVAVSDTVPPMALCQNITVQLDATGNASLVPAAVDSGSSDACGIASSMVSDTAFSCANVGANMVTLTVTDNNTNTSSCMATVTVEDSIAPIAVCQNITVQLDTTGNASITGNDVDGGSSDACGIDSLNVSSSSFTCANVGTNMVTLTVVDNNGNTATCTAMVTVEDNTAPNALCQDITVQLDAVGNGSLTAVDIDGGSSDACGIASLTASDTTFACADVGPNNVLLTVMDNNGNIDSCTAVVTVSDTVPPFAVCQNITVQLDVTGNAALAPADVDGGSNDACGIAGLMVSDTAFSCTDVGTNMVTLTVTDNNANSSMCTAMVAVEDTVAPVAVCQNITIQLDIAGNASIVGSDVDGGSSDACGIATLSASPNTFTCADVGANMVTLTVADNNGNDATCTAMVTVEDNTPPMALCQNITVQLDAAGNGSLTAADIDGGSSDACGIGSLMASDTAFTCSDVGPNNVMLTVTDNNGNVDTCTAIVTVADTVPPVAVCQNITVQLDATGNVSIAAADVDGGSSDACGIASLMVSDTAFSCSDVGANAVTLTVTDNNANFSTCTAMVMVMDTVPPTAVCQNITIQLDTAGNSSIVASDVDGGSSDACGIDTLLVTPSNFTCADTGANTVTLVVIDNNGNSANCTATVTVEDNVAPTAVCQNITVQLDTAGMAMIVASDVDGGSTDACGIASLSIDSAMFSCSNVGPNNVTLTVMDNNGNSSSCVSTVTVEDNIAPIAVCQNITVQLDITGNTSIAATDIDGGSSDACGIATLSASQNTFTCANVGTNMVTLTVVDNNGNIDSCVAQVMVMDTLPPMAFCQNINVQLDSTGMVTISAADVDSSSTDVCGIASTSIDSSMFDCSHIGPNNVILTVTDSSGNMASCTAIVTVSDNVDPVALCMSDTIYLDSAGMAMLSPMDIDGGSSDACGIDNLFVIPSMFSCANTGPNTAILTVIDNNGNVDTCSAIVTVLDTIPPMPICLADTVYLDTAGMGSITVMDIDGGSTDNCGIQSITLDDSTFNCIDVGPPAMLADLFISEYIEGSGNNKCIELYNGTGASVNMAGYTLEVYANGSASPTNTVTLSGTVIDGDVFVVCNSGATSVFTNLADQTSGLVSFNGDDAVVLRNNGTAIDIFGKVGQDPGAAWNQGGNGTANQTLVRNPDVFAGNTDDLIDFPSLGTEWTEFPQNTVTDLGSHSLIPFGATVTLTVTDNSGNSASCTAAIAVLDTIAPTAVCMSATVYLDATGNGSIAAADVDGGSTDNCGINSLSIDSTSFDCSNIGTNTVTLTVTDNSANTATCTATVMVLDTLAPVVTCQSAALYLDTAGNFTIDTTFVNGGSSDNCGIDTMYLSQYTFSCADLGAGFVTLFAEDAIGNVDSCSASLVISDTLVPIVTCVADTVYLDTAGVGVYGTNQQPVATDNCTVDTTILSQTVFACSDVGVNMVTYTAIDQSNNTDSCTISLTVLDTVGPAVSCMDTTIMVDSMGSVTIDVTFLNAGSSDACGVDTTFLSQYTFGCANLGVNNVTLTVQDVNGNQSACTAIVTVEPEPLSATVSSPVLACGHNIACNGDLSATATAVGDGACLTFSYLWSNNDTTATVTGLGAGTYTVTVTDQFNRSVADTIVVKEPAPLATSFAGDAYVCASDSSANIDLTVTGGLDCAAYSYAWSNGATTEDLSNVTAGTYVVTVTDTLGCIIIDSMVIGSRPLPTINLGPDLVKCAEDSVMVDAGPGYSSYLWSNGDMTQTSFLQTGSWWVEISDTSGCTNRDTIVVTDYVLPDSIIAPLGNLFLCGGDSVDLMAFNGYQSYLWSTGSTSQIITVVDTGGLFSVIAIDSNGCQVKDTIEVEYNPFLDPRPVIVPGPDVTLCQGSTDSLDAGDGYFSYLWSNGDTTRKIAISGSSTFTVTVSNGFGCTATSDTVTVTQVPVPVPTITKDANGILNSDQTWATYQWLLNNSAIPGGTWDSLVPQTSGAYSLMVTDSNGCMGTSDTIFCNPVAIEDQFTKLHGLELYPNPSSGMVYLRSLQPIDWNLTVTLTDMYGQVVKQYSMAHLVRETSFDFRDVANGMYVMEIVTEKGARATFRIVIE